MRPIGIGLEAKLSTKWHKDARYLCEECLKISQRLSEMTGKRIEVLELKALDGGVDRVGDYLDEIGITDLALMDELDARMIVKAAWQGSVERLRELVRDSK
jgi:hypothetical protein